MSNPGRRYNLSLFIFRRDLRLRDNLGLIEALHHSQQVLPCFIFDPRQIGEKNAYKSEPAIKFMIESLIDLNKQLQSKSSKLYCFYGEAEDIVKQLIKTQKISAVFFNRDYTPFSQTRDKKIIANCCNLDIDCFSFDDALLIPPEYGLKSDGTPYKVFTSFYNNALNLDIPRPRENIEQHFFSGNCSVKTIAINKFMPSNIDNPITGGRSECIKLLNKIKSITNYSKDRDIPSKDATTHLSAHLKFTTCSVREVYHALQSRAPHPDAMIRELFWRDFFTHIAYFFPHVFGKSFYKKFDRVSWDNNKDLFNAWKQGKTGFPMVDAGMRQLNETGYMHNRLRLITASFLVKDLHIHWLWGERYFAEKLIDYDPAVNNGNWQWVAGTGVDAQPFFRIFNPWLQQKKFDPECQYIKKWLPELRHLTNANIHKWYDPQNHTFANYPAPIIDHSIEVTRTKKLYHLE